MWRLAIFLCFLASCTHIGGSIRCWATISAGDADATQETNCSSTINACSKVSAAGVVAKSCAANSDATIGCKKESLLGVSTETCFCDKDLCNAGIKAGISRNILLAIATLILVKIFAQVN